MARSGSGAFLLKISASREVASYLVEHFACSQQRPDIRRSVDGNSVTLNGKLQSATGEEFLQHIKSGLPGRGHSLMSYDLLDDKGQIALSIRDINDVICKTDEKMTSVEFAKELDLPEERILLIN
ncbi:MAG: hypothetical protein ACREN8_00625 [Candidatus Dormibacteraceae bacterium]